MSLSNAIFSSVSGLDTASTAIGVIGDNIANVNTPGFKERRAIFGDVLGQSLATTGGVSQTGNGSSVLDVGQVFSQGTFESSSRETDLAIEGRGFFVVDGNAGRSYTRAGVFSFDRDGFLTDVRGGRVQGFGIDPLTLLSTGTTGDIRLEDSVAPPQATTGIEFAVNLPGNDSDSPLVGPFDPANPLGTSNELAVISVFDSLGGSHPTSVYFTRTGPGAWEFNATLPNPATPSGLPAQLQGTGTLSFDTSGNLTGTTGTALTYNFPGNTAANQAISLDFGFTGANSPSSQFADSNFVVNTQRQDGFSPGQLQSLGIDLDGFLTATFSNGISRPVAQVALASFPGTEGLQAVGNNSYIESLESGQPVIGAPRSGQFGAVRASSIEQSNVDLAEQFIRLILNQRAFQANTRTVSTTNELLANLVQLGQ